MGFGCRKHVAGSLIADLIHFVIVCHADKATGSKQAVPSNRRSEYDMGFYWHPFAKSTISDPLSPQRNQVRPKCKEHDDNQDERY